MFLDAIVSYSENSELKEVAGELKKASEMCIRDRNKTEFHDVVKKSLNAVRTIKKIYTMQGILCKCPLVFIITDRDTDQKMCIRDS